MKTKKRFAAAAGAMVVAASVVPFTVSAHSSANSKIPLNKPVPGKMANPGIKRYAPGISGEVSAINGKTVTVSAKTGTYTVDISSAKLSGPKNSPLTSSGINVGDIVLVLGKIDGTTVAAAALRDLGTREAHQPAYTGKITAINGSVISFSDAKGIAYKVDAGISGVKLVRRFGADMLVGDFQVNDHLAVTGSLAADGATITPTMIRDLSLQVHNGTFTGTVSSVGNSSFVIASKNRGSQTINVDASTKFKMDKNGASIADVAVGQTVIVSGVWDRANANVAAKAVTIKVQVMRVSGKVTAISGSTLTVVDAKNASYSVDASSAKVTYKHGRKADLSIVAVNDDVVVAGTAVSGANSFAAKTIRDVTKTYVKPASSS
jgi:hypothetical protein